MKVWCRLVKDNKIKQSELIERDSFELLCYVEAFCQRQDLSVPVILSKHNNEWERFAHSSFTQEHFLDSFAYDRLELEIVKEKKRD